MKMPPPVERLLVATIKKSLTDELRVELRRMPNGRWRFGTRIWFKGREGMVASKEGWTMAVEQLPEMAAAFEAALQEARDRGLVE